MLRTVRAAFALAIVYITLPYRTPTVLMSILIGLDTIAAVMLIAELWPIMIGAAAIRFIFVPTVIWLWGCLARQLIIRL